MADPELENEPVEEPEADNAEAEAGNAEAETGEVEAETSDAEAETGAAAEDAPEETPEGAPDDASEEAPEGAPEETPEETPKPPHKGGVFALLAGRKLIIVLAFPAAGILSALAIWFFVLRQPSAGGQPEQARQEVVRESGPPLMATSKALEIAAYRSELRRTNRSSHNEAFRTRMNEGDLLRIAIRGELAMLSGMFSHYMSTTAKFYELFRIMANDYVAKRSQVLVIFENELMPEYTAAEHRRSRVRRMVEHDPAVELYNRLDYIAYHDSIAVASFHEFITDGGADKFAATSELVSQSKFMIEDFRQRLQVQLRAYDVELDVPEKTWDKYFGKWPW